MRPPKNLQILKRRSEESFRCPPAKFLRTPKPLNPKALNPQTPKTEALSLNPQKPKPSALNPQNLNPNPPPPPTPKKNPKSLVITGDFGLRGSQAFPQAGIRFCMYACICIYIYICIFIFTYSNYLLVYLLCLSYGGADSGKGRLRAWGGLGFRV